MTIDKAIEILTKEQHDHHSFPTDIIGQAELLGIEALKRVQLHRTAPDPISTILLPGETKD